MKFKQESKTNSSFIDVFDIYGHSFNLHIFGKAKYKTLIGSLIGLLSLMLVVSVSLYFIVDLLERKSMTVIFNEDPTRFPVNNLSDVPIIMTLGDLNGVILDSEGLFSFDVKMLNYKNIKGANGTSKFELEIVPIKLEKCDITKHFLDKGDMFKSLSISKYFCIPPGKYNITLYGTYGDTLNGWSFLSIFINRCNSKFQKCLNDTYAESVLANTAFSLAYLSNSINHYNTTTPYTVKVDTAILQMSSSINKNYYYNLRQVIYNTDYGFIFEDHQIENFYTYASQSLDVSMKNIGLPTIGPNFGYVFIKNSDSVSNYSRAYIKGQAVMANIGGIIKSIMIIAKIISDFLTRRMSFVDLSNSIFQYKIDEKIRVNKNALTTKLSPNKEQVNLQIIPFDNQTLKSKVLNRKIQNNQHMVKG
jgi:hypothetical protein